jgi:hypothetical protein
MRHRITGSGLFHPSYLTQTRDYYNSLPGLSSSHAARQLPKAVDSFLVKIRFIRL